MINLDYPNNSEDYVHRIGRTGRSNNTGTAYTFFTHNDANKARDLIQVLEEANQVVNPELVELSYTKYNSGLWIILFGKICEKKKSCWWCNQLNVSGFVWFNGSRRQLWVLDWITWTGNLIQAGGRGLGSNPLRGDLSFRILVSMEASLDR